MFKYNYTGSVIIDSQNPYYIIENNILYNKEKRNYIQCYMKLTEFSL